METDIVKVHKKNGVIINKTSHYGMELSQVKYEYVGDGLQIWKVAANIFNKQSRTADKGRSSNLGVGRGARTLYRKNVTRYEM